MVSGLNTSLIISLIIFFAGSIASAMFEGGPKSSNGEPQAWTDLSKKQWKILKEHYPSIYYEGKNSPNTGNRAMDKFAFLVAKSFLKNFKSRKKETKKQLRKRQEEHRKLEKAIEEAKKRGFPWQSAVKKFEEMQDEVNLHIAALGIDTKHKAKKQAHEEAVAALEPEILNDLQGVLIRSTELHNRAQATRKTVQQLHRDSLRKVTEYKRVLEKGRMDKKTQREFRQSMGHIAEQSLPIWRLYESTDPLKGGRNAEESSRRPQKRAVHGR